MRRRKAPAKLITQLDAFPKVSGDYQRATTRGGTLSLVTLLIISILVVSEFFYYRGTEIKFKYSVDTDMDSPLLLNLDMTVAMPCEYLGADVVDLSGDSTPVLPHMVMEPALFEMSELQDQLFRAKRALLDQFSESRSLNDFPVIENLNNFFLPSNAATEDPNIKKTSCRIHGEMGVKKVAGNFHITTGRSVAHAMGHAHLDLMVPRDMVNFSHRIDRLSFGPPVPGGINPLDSSMKLAPALRHMFQYYLRVVPTKFSTLERTMSTNQFSVTEKNRTINHRKGSHGAPGIFFKYDLTAMSVEIEEKRQSFVQFLVRLCGIVGGIFATSGMIHALVGSLTEGVLCKLFRNGRPKEEQPSTYHNSTGSNLANADTGENDRR
jgi:hypothetical protein